MRLIDAEKAKEVLTKLLYETALNNSGGASLMCEDIAEHRLETWIGLVPTVNAEPVRHGHWVNKEISPNMWVCLCSECDDVAYFSMHKVATKYRYCTNCGAKMDEVKE